jgi:hypothetical protein
MKYYDIIILNGEIQCSAQAADKACKQRTKKCIQVQNDSW